MSAGSYHGDVSCPVPQSNGRVAQCRHILWDMATPYLRALFIKGHIPEPIGVVLNVLQDADQDSQTRRVGTLGRKARDAGHHLLADLPRLFAEGLAQLCRKFAFLRPNPKIGCQRINNLRASTFLFSVICDRAVICAGYQISLCTQTKWRGEPIKGRIRLVMNS